MTDDLLQRLRRGVVSFQEMTEAADEIERLRAEVTTFREQFAPFFRHDGIDELRARAESAERERDALRERIVKARDSWLQTMRAYNAVLIAIEQRLKSGNSVPVERATINAAEWASIQRYDQEVEAAMTDSGMRIGELEERLSAQTIAGEHPSEYAARFGFRVAEDGE